MKRVCLLFVLLLSVGIQAFAQTHTATGKVVDENGIGFPGAGVTVKGTQLGVVTDANGDFMLEVPDGSNIFVIQAVGYNSREIRERDETMIIKLVPKAKELEGTVVTALAIRREKRELGYNATTVNAEDLTAGNNVSAISALQGKVAGANITSSTGGPGGSTRIVLRGEKSILKDNNALIIVDGVITNNYDRNSSSQLISDNLSQTDFGNSANDIDPDEIESVTVLQGPEASVLYGAAGANGAVMITTKHGRHKTSGEKSKVDITYKATYTQSDILKYPDVQHTYGQGAVDAGIVDDRQDNFSWGLPFDNSVKPWGQIINGKQLVKPYADQKNNMKDYFDHGRDLNNFVSLSGGNENTTYYLALNAITTSGVVPNTFYNKYSVRFNGTTQLSNNFYSSINFNYLNTYSRVETEGQGGATGYAGIMNDVYQIPRDIPTQELSNLNNKFYSMDYLDASGVHRFGYFNAYAANPFWVADYFDNRSKSSRILGDVTLGYKKCDFNVYDRLGVDGNADVSTYKTPKINSIATDETGLYPGNAYISQGGFAQFDYNGVRLYNDLIGTYTHELTRNFGINVVLGNNTTFKHDDQLSAVIDPKSNGLVLPSFYNFKNNQGPVETDNIITDHRTVAVYGQVRLNYRKELFLEMTGRNEWSSTLITGNNSYFFPGVNASWVFTERLHGGFKDKFLNFGKVRAGIGGVGNDAIPYANNPAGYKQYPILSAFGKIQPPFNNVPAYTLGPNFGDQNLKPELTRSKEVGTDLSFFKDRLGFSFTYYNSYTHNLITLVALPPSTGFQAQYQNVGDVTNKGEEITLRGTPISTKYGLKWDVFGTYTHNVSRVESLASGTENTPLGTGGIQGCAIVAAVGRPYGEFYANDIQYVMYNGHAAAVVDPATGLPIATKKPIYEGSFQPKFQASWGTDVTYKGLKLHVLFVTKQGGVFYSNNKMLLDFVGASQETTTNSRNPYVWANSVNEVGTTGVYVPNTTKFLPYNYWTVTEQQNLQGQALVNASYVRLQEVALSYKIPQKYYRHSAFGSLEAGVFGNNLLLWTAKSNHYDDPEQFSSGATGNDQGFNFSARPSLRNYGAFLKVTF